MVKLKVYYCGRYEDDLTVSANSMEEAVDKAHHEISRRGWKLKDCWSEEIKETD